MKYPISLGDRENSFVNIHALKNLINLKIDELVDAAPETLNTLKELADAIEQNGLDDLATKELLETKVEQLQSNIPAVNTEDLMNAVSNNHSYVDLNLPSGLLWATTDIDNQMTFLEILSYSWGGNWRLPTKEEVEELLDNTLFSYSSNSSSTIVKLTSKTNSNFISITGSFYGASSGYNVYSDTCWTSTTDPEDSSKAYDFFITIGSNYNGYYSYSTIREASKTNNYTALLVLDPVDTSILHKVAITGDYRNLNNLPDISSLPNKVDKIFGKGLSKNDYTDTDKQIVNSLVAYSPVSVGDFLYEDLTCSSILDANKTVIGICVIATGELADGMARFASYNTPQNISYYPTWGTPNVNYNMGSGPGLDITGIPNYPNTLQGKDDAILDYNGKLYTLEMLSTNESISLKCYNYNPGNTSLGDWYLPSVGELYKMYTHINDVNTILTNNNLNTYGATLYTSNEVDASNIWEVSLSDGSLQTYPKGFGYGASAVAFYLTPGSMSYTYATNVDLQALITRVEVLEAAQQ